jgi:transglutaminase-like putative cysteine protease
MNTLLARRGSQDGKTRLLVTMARAVGIPARVVRGVEVRAGGVAGRSWAECWADRWIAADPVTGEFPATRALVAVALGERGLPSDLVPLLASARFLPVSAPR